jgi:hypothetical protein
MAQLKTIFFSGRKDPDTGYDFFLKLVKEKRWGVSEDNILADYIFVGGYLSALEAFLNKKIVLASYDNPVKKDYWLMHPMAKYIGLNGQVPVKYSIEAFEWSKQQTWEKLAGLYEDLWQK